MRPQKSINSWCLYGFCFEVPIKLRSVILNLNSSKIDRYSQTEEGLGTVQSVPTFRMQCVGGWSGTVFRRVGNFKKRLVASSCLSVCLSARNTSDTTGRIFMKFDIWGFMGKSVQKFSGVIKYGKNNDLCTFMVISHWVLRSVIRNILDKSCREIQNWHFMFSKFLSPKILPFMRSCEKKNGTVSPHMTV